MVLDKIWNGIGWYGFIGVITTSTTDISLVLTILPKQEHEEQPSTGFALPSACCLF